MKIRCKLTILCMVFMLLMSISAISSVYASTSIPISYLDYHSRYTFDMKDIKGTHYMVYIFSDDEKQLPIGKNSWFSEKDQVFKGNYSTAIVSQHSRVATTQDCKLFGFGNKDYTEGTFNTNDTAFKNKAYVIRSKYSGQPDILVVAQQVTGSGDANIRAFFVEDGTLYLIYWQNKYGSIFKSINTNGFKAIENLDAMSFKSFEWARSMEYTGELEDKWKLDLSRRTMVFGEQILLNKAWTKKSQQ